MYDRLSELSLSIGRDQNGLAWRESMEGANCGLHRAPRSCVEDEGGPLGVGLQELISNHLKLLWSKAMVVSV